jgi:formate dehydrogenase maturation protein FdhE
MAKGIFSAILGNDDDDESGAKPARPPESATTGDAASAPRSIPDAWARLAEQSKRLEERLAALENVHKQLLESTATLNETAKQQLQVLNYLGRFSEAAERRGREMQQQFQGVPDVLRTLPSATKEQAEKLSEIAARLYEKARDDTVNALKAAQAAHQKSIEDLIDKSLGASRRMTGWAIVVAAATVAIAFWIYFFPNR